MTLDLPRYINRQLRPYITETPQKAYTMLGLSLLTVMFFGTFGLYPAITSVITTKNNINTGLKDEVLLDKKITALKADQANFISHPLAATLLSNQLPNVAGGGSFIEQLALLASQASVRLEFVQKTSLAATTQTENRYWVGVSGGYPNIENFLKSLKGLTQLTTIDSVAVSSSSQSLNLADTGVKTTLYVSTYSYVE